MNEAEFPPGYVQCVRWMCEFIHAWLERNAALPEPEFFEIEGVQFTGFELTAETAEFIADNTSAKALLRELLAAAPPEFVQRGMTLVQLDAAYSFVRLYGPKIEKVGVSS